MKIADLPPIALQLHEAAEALNKAMIACTKAKHPYTVSLMPLPKLTPPFRVRVSFPSKKGTAS